MKAGYIYQMHLARVMNIEYAESFLDGFIYMNPISKYSEIKDGRDVSCSNSYRGDCKENSVSCTRELNKSMFAGFDEVSGFFEEEVHIDKELNSLNTLCFYLHKVDFEKRKNLPDSQMKEFGDRVVIIVNPEVFFHRLVNEIKKMYPKSFCMMQEVSYYDESVSHNELNPVFCKRDKYSYQQEFRFVVSKNGNPLEKEVRNENMIDKSPIKIDIGSIRDIAFSISIDLFLSKHICILENERKIDKEINATLKNLNDNSYMFIENYKADGIPEVMFRLKGDFFDAEFKSEGLKKLQENLAISIENPTGKECELDYIE